MIAALLASCSGEKPPPSRESEQASSPITISFQNGATPSASYAGATDATIREASATANAGEDVSCLVDGDDAGAGDLACLLRWDVTGIPAGSTVRTATLSFTATNPTGNTYNIYAINRAWTEAATTWNVATGTSDPWQVAGANGANDRGSLIGTITGSGTLSVQLNSAGVALVQSWVSTGTNYGIIIAHPTATDGLDLASSESTTVASRPMLTVTYHPPAGLQTITFQDGVSPTTAYAGTDDASIRQSSPTVNQGTSVTCDMDGDESGDVSCLIRWAVSGIPAGSSVQSATLTFNAVNASPDAYEIYALKKTWSETTVTWNAPWDTAGASAASDRDATSLGTVSGSGTINVSLDAAGIAVVQSWIDGQPNHGFIITSPTSPDGIDVSSSEATTASLRPKLTINYIPALVTRGSVWKYKDDGSDQGTAWRTTSFDDSAWASGPAELGYGDSDEATVIASGPTGAHYITSYFRQTFLVDDASAISGLRLLLDRDDGAVVYLNGTEVFRDNMPAGTITYQTIASSTTDGGTWIANTDIDPALLVDGENTIAVEVHQRSGASSDVSFDLELQACAGACEGEEPPPPPPPTPTDYLALWKLDDSAGWRAFDSASSPHHGTLYEGSTSVTSGDVAGPIWSGTGKVGRSLSFDGVNDTVRVADLSYGAAFSVAFWFKVQNNVGSGRHTLFAHGDKDNANSVVVAIPKDADVMNEGDLWTYISDGNDVPALVAVTGNYADGQWHHYALTVGGSGGSSTNAKIYVDGVLKQQAGRGGDAIDPSGEIFFGAETNNTDLLRGSLDQVYLFDRELAASDVTNLHGEVAQQFTHGAPTVTMTAAPTYPETVGHLLLNPERGWSFHLKYDNTSAMDNLRPTNDGFKDDVPASTVVLLVEQHDDHVLSSTDVDTVEAALDEARDYGLKVIPRIDYFDGSEGSEPPENTMKEHIRTLMALFNDHADVVSAVQLGSLGDDGEWTNSPLLGSGDASEGSQRVVEEYLAYLTPARAIQFRTPLKKDAHFGGSNAGRVTDGEAFTEIPEARAGHYNDCFLGTTNDYNTYPMNNIDYWKQYVGQDTRFTPMGGETCVCPSGYSTCYSGCDKVRATCDQARADLDNMNWSYLHNDYTQAIVGPNGIWAIGHCPGTSGDGETCRDEIAEKLGYRFRVDSAQWSSTVKANEILELEVEIENEGYATPYNLRPVYVVLYDGDETYLAPLTTPDSDPRRWESGAVLRKRIKMPGTVSPGSYSLALWLPDSFERIRDRNEYAIRFANTTWVSSPGYNRLTSSLSVVSGTPTNTGGNVDATFVPAW